ncbi:hypothetical protein A9K73_01600 [Mycoplasmopsis bovis]|nr:hypothetical protein A9K73_01600 [Mycoplasmopsis bovis]
MKKSKYILLTTLSPIISLPFLSASCITEAKSDNKMEKDIKINENTDEKNSSETMNNKQKQDKSSIDSIESKMKEKTEKQDSKTNSEKQDSETDDSSNELTIPSESTPKDMPTENSEINDYLDKVKEYGKEASEFYELLSKLFKTKYKDKIIQKIGKFEKIIKEFSKLYEGTKNNLDQIIEGFKEPDFKKALLELLNSYKESREEIKNAIKELKEIENESRF